MRSSVRHLAISGAVVLLAALASCTEPGERYADWEFIHAAIIVPNCATSSCHSSLSQTAGIDFEDVDASYDFLIEEFFVVPFQEESNLLFLLNGVERPLMPPDGPLPKADVDLVKAWIAQGALR